MNKYGFVLLYPFSKRRKIKKEVNKITRNWRFIKSGHFVMILFSNKYHAVDAWNVLHTLTRVSNQVYEVRLEKGKVINLWVVE